MPSTDLSTLIAIVLFALLLALLSAGAVGWRSLQRQQRESLAVSARERHELVQSFRCQQFALQTAQANSAQFGRELEWAQAGLVSSNAENQELVARTAQLQTEIGNLQAQVARTESDLAGRDTLVAQLRDQMKQAWQRIDQVQGNLGEAEHMLGERGIALADARSQLRQVSARANQLNGELAEAERRIAERDTRLAQLQIQVAENANRANFLDGRMASLGTTLGERDALIKEMGAQLTELSRRAQELSVQLIEAQRCISERDVAIVRLQSDLQALRGQIETANKQVGDVQTPVLDDFTAIRGIGPAYQKALRAAGIKSYRDLADLSPEELEKRLPRPVGRKPDFWQWIVQAKKLAG